MRNTLTIRLPEELAAWLTETAQRSGISRGALVRKELERLSKKSGKPFLRLAGSVEGPRDLSLRKGFSPR